MADLDDTTHAIFHRVLGEIEKGTLLTKDKAKVRQLSFEEIATDDFLNYVYQRELYRSLASAISTAYNQRSEMDQPQRVKLIYYAAIGEKAPKGNTAKSDVYALMDMLEYVHPNGIPIELIQDADLWTNLEIPLSVDLQPIAMKCLDLDLEHNPTSGARRLVRKFKKHYPLIISRYILGEQLEHQIYLALKELEITFQKIALPFNKNSGI